MHRIAVDIFINDSASSSIIIIHNYASSFHHTTDHSRESVMTLSEHFSKNLKKGLNWPDLGTTELGIWIHGIVCSLLFTLASVIWFVLPLIVCELLRRWISNVENVNRGVSIKEHNSSSRTTTNEINKLDGLRKRTGSI
nr:hypothetical protein [Tanacetum cinerariifolium]